MLKANSLSIDQLHKQHFIKLVVDETAKDRHFSVSEKFKIFGIINITTIFILGLNNSISRYIDFNYSLKNLIFKMYIFLFKWISNTYVVPLLKILQYLLNGILFIYTCMQNIYFMHFKIFKIQVFIILIHNFIIQPNSQQHQTLIIEEFEPDVFRQLIEYIHTGCVTLQPRTLLGKLWIYLLLHFIHFFSISAVAYGILATMIFIIWWNALYCKHKLLLINR